MNNNEVLTEKEIEKNYILFKKMLKGYISRDGIEDFLIWLDTTDAKIAPCSTKYHNNYAGGLIAHCLGVFTKMFKLMQFEFGDDLPYSKETIALVSLLHDVDKFNKYATVYRNVKNDAGEWEKVPSYAVREDKDKFSFGTHSENSLYILSKYFDLSFDEAQAILYHMGGMDYSEKDCQRNVSFTFTKNKLAFFLHVADLYDTAASGWNESYDATSFISVPESEEVAADQGEEITEGAAN